MLPMIQVPTRFRNAQSDKKAAAIGVATQHITQCYSKMLDLAIAGYLTQALTDDMLYQLSRTIVNGTLATMRGGTYE